jgi:hypothetical protein
MPAISFGSAGDPLAGRCILHLASSLDDTSTGRGVVAVAGALVEAGARALVACEGGMLIPELQAKGAVAIDLPLDTQNPLRLFLNARRIAAMVRAEDAQVIHAWSRGPAFSSLLAAKRQGIPLVTNWKQEAGRAKAANLYAKPLERSSLIIVSSEHAREKLAADMPHLASRLQVLRRPVNLVRHDPDAIPPARIAAVRSSLALEADAKMLLVAGNRDALAHPVMAEAMAKLSAVERNTVKSVFLHEVADQAAAMIAAAALLIIGPEARDAVTLAVEAQAIGVPVIVVGEGPAAEAVRAPPKTADRERTGWRVGVSDADAIAASIHDAVSLRPSLRAALIERARRHAAGEYSPETMAAAMLDHYRMLLQRLDQQNF